MQTIAIVLLIADVALLLLTFVPIVNVLLTPVDTRPWCASRSRSFI